MKNIQVPGMTLHDRVRHRLKLRDLRVLLAVVEWGSMAKAAAHLNLTQSGVSKAISELERTLGVRLLDRTAHGVELTVYGHALRRGSVAVFDELHHSVNEIENLADPTAGELHLGCTEPMLWGLLPTVITRLTQQYPRLTFHVIQSDPVTLRFHELPNRRIELAIGRIVGPIPGEDVEVEVLYDEGAHIVAGAQSKWVRRRKIDLAELVDELWTLPTPESYARSLLTDAFKARGLPPPRVSAISFSIPLHNALLASGQFLCVLPRSLLHFSSKLISFKVLPVALPSRPGPVGIMTLKNRTLSPVARLFIGHAREVARPLARLK